MATPADQRLLELLGKWLTSLELHAKYSSLDDDSYSQIQPWPEHQRPTRWIIDLARQKALALQSQIEERIKMGDAKFSESLELMTFLANLVGSEHIERFIPMADPATERVQGLAPPEGATQPVPAIAMTGTREMPAFIPANRREPPPTGTATVARTERKPADEQVIADAARLVQWGRKWYELAEIIAKMADRPHLTDVRRILKDNKAVIDKKAGRD
jgi:hypothetical protein